MGFFSLVLLGCGGIINPRWIGWCLIGLGILVAIAAIAELRKLFDRSPVLAFSNEGLLDRSEKPGTLIPWHDIHALTLWTLRVNGVPSTRRLILSLGGTDGDARKRSIDLDNLKGSPRQIAETVLSWVNRSRQAAGDVLLELGEGSGENPKS